MISSQTTDQGNNLGNQFKLKNKTTSNEWKTVGIRIKSQDLPALNQRLRLYGFETLGQLVADFLISKFPPITEDRQIQTMDSDMQSTTFQQFFIQINKYLK